MSNKLTHYSVMLNECIDALQVSDNKIYFDGTLGGAGHSKRILEKSSPNGRLVATDLDSFAIERANEVLSEYKGRYTLVRDNFKNFTKIKEELNIEAFDGVILDLGVSSFQLDDRERGFSYMADDVELDMRMDKRSTLTAKKVVNEYSQKELENILFTYGEEKFTKNIVSNIIKERQNKSISTCGELVKIIEKSIPKRFQTEGHVAKRTFQALRIEVNKELDGLKETIKEMVNGLKKGGRIAILTFHSLEDRAVKLAFNELEASCICPKSFPVCVCNKKQEIKIINKHPICASEKELLENKRSKSAKLRIAEKI